MQKFNEILHCDLLNWFHIDVAEMSCRCCVAGGGQNVSPCRIAVVSQKSKIFWPFHYDHSLRHESDMTRRFHCDHTLRQRHFCDIFATPL